jgi:hypothetical protein
LLSDLRMGDGIINGGGVSIPQGNRGGAQKDVGGDPGYASGKSEVTVTAARDVNVGLDRDGGLVSPRSLHSLPGRREEVADSANGANIEWLRRVFPELAP